MSYDITDAKDDIQLLDLKVNEILRVLKEKGLILEAKDEKPA